MYLRETFVVSIVTQFSSYLFLAFQNLSSQICLKFRIKSCLQYQLWGFLLIYCNIQIRPAIQSRKGLRLLEEHVGQHHGFL